MAFLFIVGVLLGYVWKKKTQFPMLANFNQYNVLKNPRCHVFVNKYALNSNI